MPPPIDPGKSMGEYLFGKDFGGSYQGITDPRLQERLIGAESRYRPQYTALELQDINVMAEGLPGGTDNPQYRRLEAKLAGLEAGKGSLSSEEAMKIARAAAGPAPGEKGSSYGGSYGGMASSSSGVRKMMNSINRPKELEAYEAEVRSIAESLGGNRASQIASVKAEMEQIAGQKGQKGLFQLLEDQSRRAGDLQREQLGLQRADDVSALKEFAPQVVDAYRDADPYSTGLAEQQTAMADDLYQRSQGLNPEQQRLVDQQALGMAQRQGRVTDQSAIAGQLMGREQYLSGLRGQAAGMGQQAFNQNRLLAGDIGNTILGRSSSAITLGGQSLSAAQRGAEGQMGPQLFDANVGYNAALQQRGQDITFKGMQAQADASRDAARTQMIGQVMGSAVGAMSGGCWVAREVYGIENPKWIDFREWMFNDSPSWFRNLYLKYGERIAKFISNKPHVKSIIRKWMNTKIK